ncbi:catalase HPII [Pelomyxa schiedti]|nr:catalase HPII [Pelomyxa schiedti]
MKFPDFVHANRPEPNSEIPNNSSAHATFWDFVVNTPESAHHVLWQMSDRALPRSYRMMEGFGINSFYIQNDEGKRFVAKFVFKPLLGSHSLVWDEAQKLAGHDPDFLRRDLWEAIEQENWPEYSFGAQLISEEEAPNFPIDILDPTKLWPEELVPVTPLGKLVLNRNPTDFFAETEQVAFCPANIVPGIDFTDDPILQGRLFSYLDTQLSRFGGPNFTQIPINRPLVPVHNNQRGGFHQMAIKSGRVAYSNNTICADKPTPSSQLGFVTHPTQVSGPKLRIKPKKFGDYFSQAEVFWNSQSPVEQAHIITAFGFELGMIDPPLRLAVIELLEKVSPDLAHKVARAVGAPYNVFEPKLASSPVFTSLSLLPSLPQPLKTMKVCLLIGNGFVQQQHSLLLSVLTRLGTTPVTITAAPQTVSTQQITASVTPVSSASVQMYYSSLVTAKSTMFDAVCIPGGSGIDVLMGMALARQFVEEAFTHYKPIIALGDGIKLLTGLPDYVARAGLAPTPSKLAPSVMQPRGIVESHGVFTCADVSAIPESELSAAVMTTLSQWRHWDRI